MSRSRGLGKASRIEEGGKVEPIGNVARLVATKVDVRVNKAYGKRGLTLRALMARDIVSQKNHPGRSSHRQH